MLNYSSFFYHLNIVVDISNLASCSQKYYLKTGLTNLFVLAIGSDSLRLAAGRASDKKVGSFVVTHYRKPKLWTF